ncbi:thiol-disulfide oxidoreductase DCC family protein [Neosynechococcus sphagnicola]|uniref:thiol-disulfide oxidoreductase DCC family protein n=1 Tax=Neosynechococcus sphagnicola TaxID=1501145 RepID=UPI000907A289|nr:DCC1-like thiol-disulfide oxidoreductase family protein [Neosynechococcus sphagnicola]
MSYLVIYDGNCNLCVGLVQLLETLDQGVQFQYAPMQAQDTLQQWGVQPGDCQQGMILIHQQTPANDGRAVMQQRKLVDFYRWVLRLSPPIAVSLV